jgi:transmembrane sensor
VARLSGHPRDALEPLERAITEHSHHPGAALAAFTLGRIHLDSLGDAASAAHDFDKAIALGLPQALVEDAYLRLIEARAKAGDRQGAHQAWLAHHQRFPQSARRSIADHWGREP